MLPRSVIYVLALAASIASAAPTAVVRDSLGSSPTSPELPKRAAANHKGLGTVFLQGGAAGSCGQVHPDSSHIVAISNFFQKNESPGPKCGQKIQVLNTGSNDGVGGKGKSVTVTVADTCPSCDENHLDLSVGAWNTLTGNAPFGTVNINWHFL